MVPMRGRDHAQGRHVVGAWAVREMAKSALRDQHVRKFPIDAGPYGRARSRHVALEDQLRASDSKRSRWKIALKFGLCGAFPAGRGGGAKLLAKIEFIRYSSTKARAAQLPCPGITCKTHCARKIRPSSRG